MTLISKVRSAYSTLSLGKKAAIWFVFCSFLQKGVTFLTTPVFTRLLSTEQYGYWTLFQSWETVLTIVITLNLTSGCYMQSLVKFDDRKDDLTSSFATLLSCVMLVFLGVFLAAPEFFAGLIGLPVRYILAMYVSIWSSAMYLFWTVRQRVDLNYGPFVALSVAYTLAVSVVGVVAVLVAPEELKADARVFSYAGTCFLMFVGLGIRHFIKGREHFSAETWGRALRYNLPLIPHYLSQVLLNQFSRVQVNMYCGVAAAGVYGLAYSVGMAVQMLNSAVLNVLTPWMYQKIKEGREGDAKRGFLPVFAVLFAACLLVSAMAPELIAFFAPPSYSEAAWIVPPIAVCVYFMFAQSVYDNYILYHERTVFLSIASIVAAAANIALNALVIPRFGLVSAGYTTLVCFVLSSACHCAVSRRVMRSETGTAATVPVRSIYGMGAALLAGSAVMTLLAPHAIARYVFAVAALAAACVAALKAKRHIGR